MRKQALQHFRLLDLVITLMIAGSGVVALMSPYVNPEENWLYAFFALLFPLIFVVNCIVLLYWLIRLLSGRRRRWAGAFFPLIVLVWGWLSPARPIRFNSFAQARPERPVVRLMSYNSHGLRLLKEQKEDFDKFMKKYHPDILMMQETGRSRAQFLSENFDYPFVANAGTQRVGTAILSKYPIFASGQKHFYKSGNSFAWADVEVQGMRWRMLSIHLQSNAISTETQKLAADSDLKKMKTWRRIRKIFALYRMTARQRAEQSKEILNFIARSPYPVFLCGDFNDPPLSYSYRLLSQDKQDTFVVRGKGVGTTYPELKLALRIDYILVPAGFKVLNHRIPRVYYSDHFPILADITWQN